MYCIKLREGGKGGGRGLFLFLLASTLSDPYPIPISPVGDPPSLRKGFGWIKIVVGDLITLEKLKTFEGTVGKKKHS